MRPLTSAIHTSDWHGDWITRSVPRFAGIEEAAKKTVSYAVERKCSHYFFTGDLCDPDRNFSSFRCVRLMIQVALECAAVGIEFHAIPGNHDVIEDGSGDTVLTPLKGLDSDGIHIWDRPGVHWVDDKWKLLVLPYTPLSHTYEPEKFVTDIVNDPSPLVVMSHLSVPGIQPGEETKDMPRGRDVVLPLEMLKNRAGRTIILQGHYHARHVTPEGFEGKDVLIPGSLSRLTFSEERNTPGFLHIGFS